MEMNTEELEKRLAEMEKTKAQKMHAKDRISSEMDALDIEVARQMMKEAGDELAADHTTDMGKKLMLQAMIERVDLFPERLDNGRYVKGVTFKFPVMLEGEMTDQWWYKESTVETVSLIRT